MLTYVKPTIDYVLDLQYPSKNIPSSVNSTSYDILVQWCHGAPGAIHLVSLAYEVFHTFYSCSINQASVFYKL